MYLKLKVKDNLVKFNPILIILYRIITINLIIRITN